MTYATGATPPTGMRIALFCGVSHSYEGKAVVMRPEDREKQRLQTMKTKFLPALQNGDFCPGDWLRSPDDGNTLTFRRDLLVTLRRRHTGYVLCYASTPIGLITRHLPVDQVRPGTSPRELEELLRELAL